MGDGERGAYLTRNRAEGLDRRLAHIEGRLEGRIEALERELDKQRAKNEQMRTILLALVRRAKNPERNGEVISSGDDTRENAHAARSTTRKRHA